MPSGLGELHTELGSDGACFTNEGGSHVEMGVHQPPTGREMTAERLANTNTAKVVRSTTGMKSMPIKGKTGKSKSTQMLGIILPNPFMTTHAATLPGPDATLPPGVGKAGPTIWGEEENEYSKVSEEQHTGCQCGDHRKGQPGQQRRPTPQCVWRCSPNCIGIHGE